MFMRIKEIKVTPQLIVRAMVEGFDAYDIVDNALPKDSIITDVRMSEDKRDIIFTIDSREFPEFSQSEQFHTPPTLPPIQYKHR